MRIEHLRMERTTTTTRARVFVRPLFVAGVSSALSVLALGCPEPVVTPEVPDAFRMTRDVGPIDAWYPDAYQDDAPLPDTGPRPDAFDPRDVGADAPRDAASSTTILVDGRLTERAWDVADTYSTSETTFGPYAGTVISRMNVVRSETELALAIAGTFPSDGQTVVVYLDLDYPDLADGIVLTPAGLGDRTGQLDSVLSNSLMTTDSTFRPELGWGAVRRPEAITTGSATIGWRALRQTDPHMLLTNQRSACSLDVCETIVSLEALGVDATTPLGLVVRVGDTTMLDTWAPLQTIPNDPDPEFVSVVLTIPAAS
jgi:hypothetical protein